MASTFVTRGPAITILDDHLSFTLKKTTRCCVSIERFQSLLGTIGGVRLFQILVLKNAKSNSFKKLEVQLHCFSVLRQDPPPFPSTVTATTSWNLKQIVFLAQNVRNYILSGGRGQGGKIFLVAICLLLYKNCLSDILHLFQRFNNFQTLIEYGETRLDKFTVIFL